MKISRCHTGSGIRQCDAVFMRHWSRLPIRWKSVLSARANRLRQVSQPYRKQFSPLQQILINTGRSATLKALCTVVYDADTARTWLNAARNSIDGIAQRLTDSGRNVLTFSVLHLLAMLMARFIFSSQVFITFVRSPTLVSRWSYCLGTKKTSRFYSLAIAFEIE